MVNTPQNTLTGLRSDLLGLAIVALLAAGSAWAEPSAPEAPEATATTAQPVSASNHEAPTGPSGRERDTVVRTRISVRADIASRSPRAWLEQFGSVEVRSLPSRR